MNVLLSFVLIFCQVCFYFAHQRLAPEFLLGGFMALPVFYAMNALVAIPLFIRGETKGQKIAPVIAGVTALAFLVVVFLQRSN